MIRHWADVYVEELRDRAKSMKAFGDDRGAKMCEETARELEQRRQLYEDEELTATQGAEESGYSPQRLRQLRHEGLWSGKRRDLPRHPALVPSAPRLLAGDAAQEQRGQTSIASLVGRGTDGRTRRRSAAR